MSSYFNKGQPKSNSKEGHGDHGHGDHGHDDHVHISVEEAKAASHIVNSGLVGVHRGRLGLYRVIPVINVLTGRPAKENFQHWNSNEIKQEVLHCAKELNRFRYCEDNYSAETKNPSEEVENEEYACTEEQWQATECLTGESPDTAQDIFAFAHDVNSSAQLLRRLTSHIQIPREWQEVVDEIDVAGLTEPGREGPDSFVQSRKTEKLVNSMMKSIFSQEMHDYARACREGSISADADKKCQRAQNVLAQSWVALQTSRYNARGEKYSFTDIDTQKGNKIRKWKKANVVGGDKSLRRIEVHPADHWISTLKRKGGKYDWLPEIRSRIEASLNEGREEEKESQEEPQEQPQEESQE